MTKAKFECQLCISDYNERPKPFCGLTGDISHWAGYTLYMENKLDMKDDDRDKLDMAEWLENANKTRKFNCHSCGRHYEVPVNLISFSCVCGQRQKLCSFGYNPTEDLIFAMVKWLGNERQAQLAYLAELVVSQYSTFKTLDEVKKAISDEINRWEKASDGSYIKKK